MKQSFLLLWASLFLGSSGGLVWSFTTPSHVAVSRQNIVSTKTIINDQKPNAPGISLHSTPPGKDVPSPDPSSLVAAKPDTEQKAIVLGIGTGLVAGSLGLANVLGGLDSLLGGFLTTIIDFTVPIPLGLVFCLVGATHFVYKKEYAAIVPPTGSWGGLWQVPAPGADALDLSEEDYHVLWSGVAEMGGGLLLILGGLHALPVQIPAFLLYALTLAVSPANIYMFTHDKPLAMAPPLKYPDDHIVRGVAQIILLALFAYLVAHG